MPSTPNKRPFTISQGGQVEGPRDRPIHRRGRSCPGGSPNHRDRRRAAAGGLEDQPALPGMGQLEAQVETGIHRGRVVARYGETLRQRQWRDELLACGIRGKGGQRIEFPGSNPWAAPGGSSAKAKRRQWLVASGQGRRTKRKPPRRSTPYGVLWPGACAPGAAAGVDGPGRGPAAQPDAADVIFATFQFDPEAAKDIDETKWPGVTLLKVQMNTDLLTDDLKKNRSSNESYWLMGQPDVELRQVAQDARS